jgi:hypothetical protein
MDYFSRTGTAIRCLKDLWSIVVSYIYFLTAVILMNTLDTSNLIVKNITGYMFATGIVFVIIALTYVFKRK